MKQFKTLFLVTMALIIASCSSSTNQPPPQPSAGANGSFTWRENDVATIFTAYSPTFSTQYKTLIAKNQAGATLFEVNLANSIVGSYSINNTSNVVTYTGVSPFFVATSGTVIISASANGKMSGSFEAFRSGSVGTITRMYATFVDVIIIP